MKTNRGLASCVAALALAPILLTITSARADTFTATFHNGFGDGVWERDAHIGVIGNPGDPDVPGNWSTGAFPHNGHAITNPNTGLPVPGPNPLYDVVVNINGCTVRATPFIQTLSVGAGVNLKIEIPAGLIRIDNGQVVNNGTITINDGVTHPGFSAPALSFATSNAVLSGNGSVNLRGFGTTPTIALFIISGVTLTHAASHLIHGLGTINGFSATGTLINNGTISADDPNGGDIQLNVSDVVGPPNQNNGLIQAIGGGVMFFPTGYIDQSATGSFFADGNGSIVRLGGGRGPKITGGSLNTANGGLIMSTAAGGGAYLVGCTNNGDFLIPPANNPIVVLNPGLTNNGTITIGDGTAAGGFGTALRFDANGLLDGSGSVHLRGIGANFNVALSTSGGITLTHGASHLVHGVGLISAETLINSGTISADDPNGGTLFMNLTVSPANQNNGLIQAIGGGLMLLNTGLVDQTSGGSMLASGNGSRLQIGGAQGVGIVGGTLNTTNNGIIQSKYSVLRGNITNSGTFEMLPGNGSTLVEATTLTNNGTMTAASDSTFRFDANNTAIGGTGAIVLPANTTMIINGGQAVTNGSGHTIKGNGTIFVVGGGSFTNNAIVAPGLSPGKLTVSGNYTQGSTGVLNMEIGGSTPVTGYDQLAVTGNAALSGTLNISLINGFLPAVGDVFQIITTGSFSGAFTTINTTGFTGQVNYSAGSITMTVLTIGTPTPSQLLNISTRMRVQTGENVLIGGFIITGTDPRQVIIRAIGPSLSIFFPGALADTTLELFQGNTLLASNDNWRVPSQNESDVLATGIPPGDNLESALVRTLQPGTYTAIVRGNGGASGIGLVEAYALGQGTSSRLANISTRGFVETDNNVMIGGLIIGPAGGSNARVAVRAIGPSLADFGIPGTLQDPALELKDANGTTLISNNDWQQGQPAEIQQAGLAPGDPRESALLATVPPGNYTAIVSGVGSTTGVGLVEVYHLQ